MKAYIIKLEGHDLSTLLAKDCFDAAISLNFDVEYFNAIDQYTVDNFFKFHQIKLSKDKKMQAPGTRGCFASHYSLWSKILEKNETSIILEHDGMLLKQVDLLINDIVDVCHLDPYNPYTSTYNNDVNLDNGLGVKPYERDKEKRVTGKYFRGAYSYILTPSGANKLINFIKENGAFTADRSICENAVNLQSTVSSHARLHPFFNNTEKIKKYCTRTEK